ncbi:MAG: prepilin peptidase, partial [Bdellovibrionia bacterium]
MGALLGSFGNVVIYRLPKNESVVTPRSRCGSCSKQIAFYDNIPIFSWFILRGKCRNCGAKYSFRYPFVELLMGSLFAGLFLFYGFQWLLLEYLVLV